MPPWFRWSPLRFSTSYSSLHRFSYGEIQHQIIFRLNSRHQKLLLKRLAHSGFTGFRKKMKNMFKISKSFCGDNFSLKVAVGCFWVFLSIKFHRRHKLLYVNKQQTL